VCVCTGGGPTFCFNFNIPTGGEGGVTADSFMQSFETNNPAGVYVCMCQCVCVRVGVCCSVLQCAAV